MLLFLVGLKLPLSLLIPSILCICFINETKLGFHLTVNVGSIFRKLSIMF